MKIEQAEYHTAILPEHRGNPLIEALPKKVSDEVLIRNLAHYPPRSIDETKIDAMHRVEYLTRLRDLRQPMPVFLDCYRAIELAIKESYAARNPFSASTANYLHYTDDTRPKIRPITGEFSPKGSGITVIGESGVGKTKMLEQILHCFPDIIEHDRYGDRPVNIRQVVWLHVQLPGDSSVRGLCHDILAQLDFKLGFEPTKPASTIDTLLRQIEARIKSSFLGILVIDEMQNLNIAKASGAERLLGFIHNLVNSLGIPILFCANPPFNELLSQTLKAARRAESRGYFSVEVLKKDELWDLFIEELWVLQWTNVETPLTRSLSNKLHELSAGIIEVAVRIYIAAQTAAIGSSDERITESILEYASSISVVSSQRPLDLIRRANIATKISRRTHPSPNKDSADNDLASNEKVCLDSTVKVVPGDLSRPQHPEFFEKLNTLKKSESLLAVIKDPDLIRRLSASSSSLQPVLPSDLVCNDLSDYFGR